MQICSLESEASERRPSLIHSKLPRVLLTDRNYHLGEEDLHGLLGSGSDYEQRGWRCGVGKVLSFLSPTRTHTHSHTASHEFSLVRLRQAISMLHYLKLNYFTAHFGECQIVLREEILIKCNAHPSSRGNKINETPNPISPNGNYVRELHSSLVLLRNPWRRSDHRQTLRECIFIKFLFKFLINFMNNNFIINSISQPRRRRMSVCLWVFVPECVCVSGR